MLKKLNNKVHWLFCILMCMSWPILAQYDTGTTTNTYVGKGAGNSDGGTYNTSMGINAGDSLAGVTSSNILIGVNAGRRLRTSGQNNVAIGRESAYNLNAGDHNITFGYRSGYSLNNGFHNIMIGVYAGTSCSGCTANVYLGPHSGLNNINGNRNTFLGFATGQYSAGNDNIFIGYNSGKQESGDNKLYIDVSDTSIPLVFGDFASNQIGINSRPNSTHTLTVGGSLDATNYYKNGQLIQFTTPWTTNQQNISFTDGNVGIGTDQPGAQLEIRNQSNPTTIRLSGNRMNGSNAIMDYWNSSAGFSNTSMQLGKWDSQVGLFSLSFGNGTATPVEQFRINSSGNVMVGTQQDNGYKLSVNGNIRTKEVNITLDGWADFVFNPEYDLPDLLHVKYLIQKNHHLPLIPSEIELFKSGLDLGEMNKLLLLKIEELTLYTINQEERLRDLEKQNQLLLKLLDQ